VDDVAAAAAPAVIVPPKHQHEARLPDNLLLAVLEYLPVHAIAQTMQVCHRWKAVSQSEILWRGLCKRAVNTFHPKLGAAPAAPPPSADNAGATAADAASASDSHAGRASAMVAAAAMVDPLAALSFDYSATSAAGPAPPAAPAGAASGSAPIPRVAARAAAVPVPSVAPVVAASRSTIGTDTGDGHGGARGAAAAGTDERQYSLSISRQRALDEDFAARSALKADRDRASAARAAVLDALKGNLKRLGGSYRAAFFLIPLVRRALWRCWWRRWPRVYDGHTGSALCSPPCHAGVDARRVRAAAFVHP